MMGFLIQKVYATGLSGPDAVSGNIGLSGPDGVSNSTAFNTLLQKILDNIVTPAIYLIAALAVVYFVWGVMVFVKNADNPEKRAEGYQHMIWGIVGLFIMVSAKGIIRIIMNTMGL